ncbi:polysaccharide deacetylase family protein [Helicobacter turcicus]|uniref:polysaccharide deacetylase family protein n=1 Tax=Helicobacter turcicus TaxID=2867412 RepID=UPI001F45489A|nr:polysaccharide deacetylase family protein [Helicobacter turcicus]
MKAIMYHYVRKSDKNTPFFRYLDFENFKKQLDYFEKNYSFLTYEEFLNLYENPPQNAKQYEHYKGKILLTFDDGLKDHYDFVFKELKKRGLFGFFFVCSGVYERKKALDVHRIHFLLGKLGGKKLLDLANEKIKLFQKQKGVCIIKDSEKAFFENKTYLNQDNDFATSEFKKLFNYYIKYAYRESLLDSLMEEICEDYALFENLYMSIDALKTLQKEKMIVGSHSHNHFVLSKLTKEEQKQELQKSFEFLEQIIGGGGLDS